MSRARCVSTGTAVLLCAAVAFTAAASLPLSAQGRKLPITWAAPSAAVRGTAGEGIAVEVSARIDEGWHLYSLTQPSPPDPTVISVESGQPFSLTGAIEAPAPERGFDEAQGADTEYYTESVTFRLPLAVEKSARPGDCTVRVTAKWQACNGSLCLRPQTTTIEVPVRIVAGK